MDELNPQMQNPSMPQAMPPPMSGPSPMPSMLAKKKSGLFWIVIVIIVAVGGLAWWYVGQMTVEEPVVKQPNIDKEAREDIMINNDIESTDLGNVDKEFNDVDKDLNSL